VQKSTNWDCAGQFVGECALGVHFPENQDRVSGFVVFCTAASGSQRNIGECLSRERLSLRR
jgi:hypothetical protein